MVDMRAATSLIILINIQKNDLSHNGALIDKNYQYIYDDSNVTIEKSGGPQKGFENFKSR